jgi:DNA-binding CsgD family transcriptional regulator
VADLSTSIVDLVNDALRCRSADQVGRQFHSALQTFGVRAIYARAYGLEIGLPSQEQIYSRISPPGWETFYAERRFQDLNYLEREARGRAKPFAWSEIKLISPAERDLARALIDNGFPDGIATPCHGPHGYLGVVSLAFERLTEVSPHDRAAIEMASLILHSRMRDLAAPPSTKAPQALTPRERDCIGFIADGRSDSYIADVLGIADVTVLTHVQNAKRKLGAKTRAQAVAFCINRGLLHSRL